jgi:hypothetical protein
VRNRALFSHPILIYIIMLRVDGSRIKKRGLLGVIWQLDYNILFGLTIWHTKQKFERKRITTNWH